jgi:hypothetical protein
MGVLRDFATLPLGRRVRWRCLARYLVFVTLYSDPARRSGSPRSG